MKKPSKIADIMSIEMRAKNVSKEKVGGAGRNTTGRYRYEAVFTDKVTMERIEDKVALIEDKEGLSLQTVSIEPRLYKTQDSLQSGFAVTITETENRAEIENEDLTTFADNNEHEE